MASAANDRTPLMLAAFDGDLQKIERLLESGEDVNAVGKWRNSPLMVATNLETAKLLVERGADLHAANDDGNTAMMVAVWKFKWEVVKYLVDRGTDVNAVNKFGLTPLAYVTEYGELEMVKYLVDRGAHVNSVDSNGLTPLVRAIQRGKLEITKFLTDQGADMNAVDHDGRTPLMCAAAKGEWGIAKYLVHRGAALNVADNNGMTPLTHAVDKGNLEMVRYLVERGAAVDTTDLNGNAPLTYAASAGELEVLKYLMDHGADVNAVDKGDVTVLMYAAKSWGCSDVVVEYLLDQHAYINAVDKYGMSALIYAADSSNLNVVRCLVDRGADVNAVDSDGMTPLMRATARCKLEIVKYLVDRGADVNLKTTKGQTAVHQAARHGYIAIRDFLLHHVKPEPSNSSLGRNSVAADLPAQSLVSFTASKSWAISPFDVALSENDNTMTTGGEYRAKWLDADVVLKLFTPDASALTFVDEVATWHQLRHPNVIKLYGACNVGHSFFVLEFARNGSVVEFLAECGKRGERRMPWKLMHEAALGLAYLHERGIVHGNLRISNILVGSDGVAKLADFGLASSQTAGVTKGNGFGAVRWQAPEQLHGSGASLAADIYSFGLCIVQAVTGREPWEQKGDLAIRLCKSRWQPESQDTESFTPGHLDQDTNLLICEMCIQDPKNRMSAVKIARLLERLAIKEADEQPGSQAGRSMSVGEYKSGELTQLSANVQAMMSSQYANDPMYVLTYQEIQALDKHLQQKQVSLGVLENYHSLLVDLADILQPISLRTQVLALSSTRATHNTITALRRRINDMWVLIDESHVESQDREQRWNSVHNKQLDLFVSDLSQTMTVLSQLDDEAARSEFIVLLKTEIDSHNSSYTDDQLAAMKKAYKDCCQFGWGKSVTTIPVWFLPWHELVINRMNRIGEGGFGEVYLAKWLDSEVVVKEVKALGSSDNRNSMASTWSECVSMATSNCAVPGAISGTIRSQNVLRALFEQEVNVWFGLSHPHVVRLFGACHVGTPFFACEYAGGGSLDKYLRRHPDEIWAKLYEAGLGVQYLQSRNIVHGDLKCNNIVVGNDGKAKVTDFGLSSFEEDEGTSEAFMSGAWQWVAPECLVHGASKRSFASDIYSLGMCIVEALRVVELVKLDEIDRDGSPPLPWGSFDNPTVKYYVSRKKLPQRPQVCSDEQWELVKRMCTHGPADRISISTAVDGLGVLARGGGPVELTEPELEFDDLGSVLSEELAKMELMCRRVNGKAGSKSWKVLCSIYELVWTRLARLTSSSEKGEAALEHLRPLLQQARERTMLLEEQQDTLFAFTEAALRGYALHRALDKAIEAERWRKDEWRERCWELLTAGLGPIQH